MKRWSLPVIAGAFAVGVLLLGISNIGHWLSAPRTEPAQGDLIVALGGGAGGGRVQVALDLYHRRYADKILLTGVSKTNPLLQWETKFLFDRGVKSDALLFDDQSKNSYEEAVNTVQLMKGHGWRTALVISDPPHLRRLAMVWGPACVRDDVHCRLISTEPSTWNSSDWWHDKVWARYVGMELMKIVYYALAY